MMIFLQPETESEALAHSPPFHRMSQELRESLTSVLLISDCVPGDQPFHLVSSGYHGRVSQCGYDPGCGRGHSRLSCLAPAFPLSALFARNHLPGPFTWGIFHPVSAPPGLWPPANGAHPPSANNANGRPPVTYDCLLTCN